MSVSAAVRRPPPLRRRGRPWAVQVLVSVPSTAVARRIASELLEQHLCACVQTLGPMTSRYRWHGKLAQSREWLLLIKTRAALYPAVERTVRRLHPYDVPEILCQRVTRGLGAYLDWLERETVSPRLRARRVGAAAPRHGRAQR